MSTITEDVYPLEKHENQVEKVIPAEGQGTVTYCVFCINQIKQTVRGGVEQY
jgi:hypothetical protein